MPVVVSLEEIVAAMDVPNSEWESYLDPESGEIVTLTEEELRVIDEEESELEPEGQSESLARIREMVESGRWLRLPDSFEIHEWSIMERFCHALERANDRDELLDAIHGSGAFRLFRSSLERLGLRDRWYAYRQAEFERIAREWLGAQGISFK